jgi:peptidoglycan/LPS O-acetylase OafA/YrhL
MSPQQRRLPALDGLRGVAILTVVVAHYVHNSVPRGALWTWSFVVREVTAYGWSGVDLFFVLSGFLIGGIVLDNRDAPNFLRVFYARRALRILPLYWLLLAAFAASGALLAPHMAPAASHWLHANAHSPLSYLTFGQNIETGLFSPHRPDPAWVGVTWSLAVEEHFYFVVPLTLMLLPRRAIPWSVAAVVLITPVLRALVWARLGPTSVYILTPCRVDSLLVGVLCAWAVRCARVEAMFRRNRFRLYLCAALLGGTLLVAQAAILHNGRLETFWIVGYSIVACFYASLLLLAVTEEQGPVTTLLRSRVLQRAGVLAYGLYLFHQPTLGLAHALVHGAAPRLSSWAEAATTTAAIVCVYAVAELSWRVLEQPLIALGHRLRYGGTEAPSEPRAARAA